MVSHGARLYLSAEVEIFTNFNQITKSVFFFSLPTKNSFFIQIMSFQTPLFPAGGTKPAGLFRNPQVSTATKVDEDASPTKVLFDKDDSPLLNEDSKKLLRMIHEHGLPPLIEENRQAIDLGNNIGERYMHFVECCDRDTRILPEMIEWLHYLRENRDVSIETTNTGKKHEIWRCGSVKFLDDLAIDLPRSSGFGKGKDQQGIYHKLKNQGWPQDRVTLSWVVCYVNGIRVDETKPDHKRFECSHICCEYDADGKRIQGARCLDAKCLVFESKSDNQSRANQACRKMCHCGCGKTICQANGIHYPPCH